MNKLRIRNNGCLLVKDSESTTTSRPHQTLKGKTPSEKADLNLELKRNKWLSLINKSVS